MKEVEEVRIDKYLWAIRLYKTRALSKDAIEGGKVKWNNSTIKSSKKVFASDVYIIKKRFETFEIKVLKLIKNRVSAELVKQCYELINYENTQINMEKSAFITPNVYRSKGTGRPTKKERRKLDRFSEDIDEIDDL